MYKVTIAIPIYNVEKHIERALLSALNQTFESIEFLLIDDRGSDNSMNIAMDIAMNHRRGKDVRVIDHGVNIGLGAVRNTAIENAKGEYLYFLDSDDEITLDCISILYNHMIEYPVDFVAASHDIVSSEGRLKEQILYNDRIIHEDGIFSVAKAYYKDEVSINVHAWNKLYDLNFLKKNNIKCSHLTYEDVLFTYEIILNAQSCRLISDVLYFYYEMDNSIMAQARKAYTPADAKIFEDIFLKKRISLPDFSSYDFYPNMIKHIFREGRFRSIAMYKSPKIPYNEKKSYIYNILKYPLPFKEMLKLNSMSHLVIYIITKVPNMFLVILLCKLSLFALEFKSRFSKLGYQK